MKKKILIVFAILGVISLVFFALVSYVFVQGVDETLKKKEPEFRKYLTMTVEEQNSYIENNLDFLMDNVIKDSKTPEEKEAAEKVKADPLAKKTGVELGRSIMAKLILSSDAIVADLKEDEKSKLNSESEKLSERFDTYSKVLEKYDTEKK